MDAIDARITLCRAAPRSNSAKIMGEIIPGGISCVHEMR
jgi:hypothetical protein